MDGQRVYSDLWWPQVFVCVYICQIHEFMTGQFLVDTHEILYRIRHCSLFTPPVATTYGIVAFDAWLPSKQCDRYFKCRKAIKLNLWEEVNILTNRFHRIILWIRESRVTSFYVIRHGTFALNARFISFHQAISWVRLCLDYPIQCHIIIRQVCVA
jgi:hypothetical protein